MKKKCDELNSGVDISKLSPEKLVENLRMHQFELEMQNDDLRLTQKRLEQTREKYIDLYEFAPIGYLTIGETGIIIEANLTAAKLFGLSRSQILNCPFTDFVEPEFQDSLYFHLKKVRTSESKEPCELKLKKHAEKSFFAHLESILIRQEHGNANEIRISFVDINDNKINAMALKESADNNEMLLNLLPQSAILIDINRKVLAANRMAIKSGARIGEVWFLDFQKNMNPEKKPAPETVEFDNKNELEGISCLVDDSTYQQRLVTVIEDSNDAVSLLDLRGNIKAWNRKAEEMYGYPTSEALKMSVFDLVPPGLKQETRQLLSDIRAGVIVKPFETKRIAKNGRIVDIYLTFTRMVHGNKILAIAATERDVTDRNHWYAALQELPRRIIMAQEKERSRISQVLHSEFGQSLIALKLFTAISASDLPDGALQIKSALDKIKTQLDKIINDTRNLAHELSPPGLRYVGLGPAIKDLVKSATMKRNLEIRFFHRNMGRACFKKKDIIIYRFLQEALQNICKHSQATRARVKAIFVNSVFTLEVSDNGKGFDPALKTSSRGLGLALMKEQAALINGALSITSQIGKGTSIKITVPIREKKKS